MFCQSLGEAEEVVSTLHAPEEKRHLHSGPCAQRLGRARRDVRRARPHEVGRNRRTNALCQVMDSRVGCTLSGAVTKHSVEVHALAQVARSTVGSAFSILSRRLVGAPNNPSR